MRAIFSILGLLVVVAIVALLARKQLGAGVAPSAVGGSAPGVTAPAATPKQQVQQFEQAVQGALQQARPMPENDK
jgi:hypothetical protein